jgi:uncharacterized phage protein (TIGR02220 family)
MKDPAFLFYSKDWIEGTAEMYPAEKGIYIDLLCYQHQKGDLPNDIERLARLVRLTTDEFIPIWENIKDKFQVMDNRMVNQKLNQVMSERSEKGIRNFISGTFASLLRVNKLSKKDYDSIRSDFKIDNFIDSDRELITERLTEWFNLRLKSIANANEDVIINKDSITIKEIVVYMNNKLGTSYKSDTNKTQESIRARMNEGFIIDDFKTVIDVKYDEWKNTDMEKYLRPETLFGNKFESYLNQKSTKNGKNKDEVDENKWPTEFQIKEGW